MNQWGSNGAQSNNSPVWVSESINQGAGPANQVSNNTALYENTTPGVFFSTKLSIGDFPITATKRANTSSSAAARSAKAGWNLRRAWSGPIVSFTANGGSSFANGETVVFSNGTANGVGTLTANATGNLISGVVTNGGTFVNSSVIVTTFQRQKHVVNLNVTGGSGFSNTDTIVVSNAISNATATFTTNATGGFQNGTITVTNSGLFANTEANTDVVVNVVAANGSASAGSGATITANLGTSSGGTIAGFVMGGRAGRIHYECLVASGSLVDASANTAP